MLQDSEEADANKPVSLKVFCHVFSDDIILSLRIRGFTECAYLPEAQESICKSNEEAVEID